MATKNTITGDEIKSRPANNNYINSGYWDYVEKKKKGLLDDNESPFKPVGNKK